jgi:hypothetical protein
MCNVTIAKTKIQQLTSRTEKDLYVLRYEAMNILPLNEDTYFKVKMICNNNNLPCPIYKYGGEIKFRKPEDNFYYVLNILAKEYNLYLDHTKFLN